MSSFFQEPGRAGEARKRYAEIICDAFKAGFSIMEITRITGGTKPDFFYSVLRDEKIIAALKRGRTPKIDLPEQVAMVFVQKKFSFVKWCHVWDFKVDEAKIGLSVRTPTPDNEVATKVHHAFRRDFPERYSYLFPESTFRNDPVVRLKTGFISPDSEQLVSVSWDRQIEKYVASIYGEDGVEGEGESWSQAIRDLEQVWWVQKGIVRLARAINESNAYSTICLFGDQ